MTGLKSKGDTAWQELLMSSSFKSYDETGNDLWIRKCGHIVTIVGCITPTATISGSSNYVNITDQPLPSEYRPIISARAIQKGMASNIWFLTVSTNGDVSFTRYRNTNSYANVYQGAQLFVNITYMTAD